MYEITLMVNAPDGTEMAIKEHIAMYMERFGDVRITGIRNLDERVQSTFWGELGGEAVPNLPLVPNPKLAKARRNHNDHTR